MSNTSVTPLNHTSLQLLSRQHSATPASSPPPFSFCPAFPRQYTQDPTSLLKSPSNPLMAQQPINIGQFIAQYNSIVANHVIQPTHTIQQANAIKFSTYRDLTELFNSACASKLDADPLYQTTLSGFRQWLRHPSQFPNLFPHFLHSRHCNSNTCQFQQIPSNSPHPLFQCSETKIDSTAGEQWECKFEVQRIVLKPRHAANTNVTTFPLSIFKCTTSVINTNPANLANNHYQSWAAKLSDLTPNDGVCDDAVRETSSYLLLGKDNHPHMMKLHSYETLHLANIHYQSTPWAHHQSLGSWVGTYIQDPQFYASKIQSIVLSLLYQLDYIHNTCVVFHGNIESGSIVFDED